MESCTELEQRLAPQAQDSISGTKRVASDR